MINKINNNIIVYYISLFLGTVALSFPHAILTVILLDKGLTLSQILIVQSGFSLAVLLFEFPSGVMADIHSKKSVYLLSNVLLITMCAIVWYANSFFLMLLAWVIYGASSALLSGTIDAQIINDLKISVHTDKIDSFVKNDNRIYYLSLIIGSAIGGSVYPYLGIDIYLIAIILVFVASLLVFFKYKNITKNIKEVQKSQTGVLSQIKESLLELKSNRLLRLIVLLNAISQIFFQTHYQLWQALLLEINIGKKWFSLVYIVFQIISILSYSVPVANIKKSRYVTILLIVLCALPTVFLLENKPVIIISYLLFVFFYGFIDYYCKMIFAQAVSTQNISALTSLKSTVGRISASLILLVTSWLVSIITVKEVIIINFIVASILTLVLLQYLLKITSKIQQN